jgi:hypothetical protein
VKCNARNYTQQQKHDDEQLLSKPILAANVVLMLRSLQNDNDLSVSYDIVSDERRIEYVPFAYLPSIRASTLLGEYQGEQYPCER